MKISNYAFVFVIAICGLLVALGNRTSTVETMIDRATQYNAIMDSALDSAVSNIIESDNGTLIVNKEKCVSDFMNSLYAGFGIIDNPSRCDEFSMYVPVIVVADVDGFYVRYYEYQASDYSIVTKWSVKYPYEYEDSRCVINFRLDDNVQVLVNGYDTVYEGNYKTLLTKYASLNTGPGTPGEAQYRDLVNACQYSLTVGDSLDASPLRSEVSFELARQRAVIDCVTAKMGYYLNKHNSVARSFGIQYAFGIPVNADSEMARTIDGITFMAVFQGYPIGSGTSDVYNKFCISGARIKKASVFSVREDTTNPSILYYHTDRCSLGNKINGKEQTFSTQKEAAATGAFPCPYCKP